MDYIHMEKKMECEEMIRSHSGLGVCERIWDGIMCWPPSEPNQIVFQQCPSYIVGFDSRENASKICTSEGWWIDKSRNSTWTNYTNCGTGYVTMAPFPEAAPLQHALVPWIKLISKTGYIISLVSLLLACSILLCNKKLRCPRNVIHLHLFISFLLRASIALLKDLLFVDGVGLPKNIIHYNENVSYTEPFHDWQCKVFTVCWQYFILANYSWILVEGAYLHNLIFFALFSDTSSIKIYAFFGWSTPAVIAISWAIARAFLDDTLCWTTNEHRSVFLFIQIPIVTAMVVNLALFLNITRVLLMKVRSENCLLDCRVSRYRKLAKSTLVLMPLFGVHYAFLLGFSYSTNPILEISWLFCDQLFASLQGLFVSILYCIINQEVVEVMKNNFWALRMSFCGGRVEEFDMWRKCSDGHGGYLNQCEGTS